MSPWDQTRYRDFWRFVAERHEIFRRRILLKEPPPWTYDPILASVAFTNIYRELDRATRVLVRSFPKDARKDDLLFNIIKFRFFTWPWTYLALGGFQPAVQWDTGRAAKLLVARQKAGHQIFTGAFMVTSMGAPPGLGGKIRLVVKRIGWVKRHLPRLTPQVFEAATMQEAHKALLVVPGFGGFMAYEVLIDVTYTSQAPFGTDAWVYVGPGAMKGLQLLVGPTAALPRQRAGDLIALLRDEQAAGLEKAKVTLRGPRLTLENVEQALCEYQKYVRAKRLGQAKRKFDPTSRLSADYSLWDDMPEVFRG